MVSAIADDDDCGQYFGASLRRGPFMSVQEDRVSKISNLFIYSYSLRTKNVFKDLKLMGFMQFLMAMQGMKLHSSVKRISRRSLSSW